MLADLRQRCPPDAKMFLRWNIQERNNLPLRAWRRAGAMMRGVPDEQPLL